MDSIAGATRPGLSIHDCGGVCEEVRVPGLSAKWLCHGIARIRGNGIPNPVITGLSRRGGDEVEILSQ